jgi:hypothetical protein
VLGRAQQVNAEDLYTDGLLNGRAWKLLDDQNRTIFVQGLRGGLALAARELQSTGVANEGQFKKQVFKLMGGKTEDLIQQVDEFYKDSANLRVPVPLAYKHMLLKLGGANSLVLDNDLSALRREFNQ